MTTLIFLLSKSRRVLAASVVLGLVTGATSAGMIWLVSDLLSHSFASSPALLAAFAGCGVLLMASRVGFMAVLGRLHQGAIFELRIQLAREILATSLRRLEEVGASRVHAALTADLIAVSEALRILPYFCIHIATCAGSLIYLAWLSWPTFLALIGFGTLGVFSYWIPTRGAFNLFARSREREDDLFKHLRSLTDGLKELRLSSPRRTAFLSDHLEPTAADVRKLNVRGNDIFSATSSWGNFLFFVFLGFLLFGMPHVADISARTLTGFAFGILYIQQPLSAIFELLPGIGRGRVALDTIHALHLEPAPSPATAVPAAPWTGRFEQLRITGITHAYHREQEDDRFVLGPVDLTIARGELVFLIGGNGSGKTTLVKLITGLYAPEAGAIELDGVAITDANRDAYRQQFSAVFADFHVFESLLGIPTDAETEARVQGYLTKLHLDRKVTIAGGRLSTVNLSQGQRKRLALLAAYLEDRPIYVFDEWAADQDPMFKAVFYQELLPELRSRGKTLIVVSHDDRYFHVADRVLRLEMGQLTAAPLATVTPIATTGHLPQGS
ncbi:MAG TPA: cyclic peptide export ABC transporter, partial [Kofleriaceae bacterium]|nr:cyclic peptide export ABC transporter [Kofleriaceae bacterium]